MKQKFFAIPALAPEPAETELNQFLSSHRIAHLEKQFVAAGNESFWSICVTWLEQEGSLTALNAKRPPKTQKVDYKEVLNDADFVLYARLRDWRKKMAEQDGIPAYGVFTNEQLAQIVQQRLTSKAALLEVEGIGQARVERYGASLLTFLQTLVKPPHEASSPVIS